MGGVYEYLNTHLFFAMLLGLTWLMLVVAWPTWKPKLLKLPKTHSERLRAIETGCAELAQKDVDLSGSLNGLASRLDQLDTLRDGWRMLCSEFVTVSLYLGDINALVYEADLSIAHLQQIKEDHLATDIGRHPFSRKFAAGDNAKTGLNRDSFGTVARPGAPPHRRASSRRTRCRRGAAPR